VVNSFPFSKEASDGAFHDEDVFQNIAASLSPGMVWSIAEDVPIPPYLPTALPGGVGSAPDRITAAAAVR
jgi:hypothetical protein